MFELFPYVPTKDHWREHGLLSSAVHYTSSARVVELGTEIGVSTQILADAVARYGGSVVTFDISDCRSHTDHIANCQTFRIPSEQACKFYNSSIDLLFIDSDHTRDQVYTELVGWSGFVRPGGLIMCHDIFSYPVVREGIMDWLSGHKSWEYDEFPVPDHGMGLLWAPGALNA